MKRTITNKVLALIFAVVLCASLSITVFAVDTTYTPVAGTNTTFQKILIMNENANVPTIDFEFSIEPGEAIGYNAGTTMEVIAPSAETGVTGSPVIKGTDGSTAKAIYSPGHATVASHEWADIADGEKAAVETLTVDFSGVSFAEPGIYRYLIKEDSEGQQGVSYDIQLSDSTNGIIKQRVLDVYVTDTGSGTLEVSQYVIHELVTDIAVTADYGSGDVTSAGTALGDKSKGFVNGYTTFDLDLSKSVSGNQASQDKYFKFDVVITNAGANVALDVDWIGAVNAQTPVKSVATVYGQEEMQTANTSDDNSTLSGSQWLTDGSGNVTKTVYLKHGQNITIKGLAAGAKYTVTETAEDYKPSTVKTSADGIEERNSTAVVSETEGMESNHDVDYINTREGVVPTGVMVSAAGGIALAVAGVGGISYAVISRKKNRKNKA